MRRWMAAGIGGQQPTYCKDARKGRLHFKMQCAVFVRTVAAHVDPDKATAAPYGTVGDDSRLADTVTAQNAPRGRWRWSDSPVADAFGTM